MPKIFGWQHIVYLIVAVIICTAVTVLIKLFCKTEKQQSIAVKIYAAVLLIPILANRILIAVIQQHTALAVIPGSFCGLTSLCFGIIGLFAKKDSKLFHWVCYCALLGGFLTMVYPDFIGQDKSIFYPLTITGLLHHTLSFFYAVTLITINWFKPSLKRWAYLPIGLTCMMTFGIFYITALGFDDAMYIFHPLIEGTPFTWWFTGLLFLILHAAALLIIEYVKFRKNKKAKQNEPSDTNPS